MPFSPEDVGRWTEEHFEVYTMIELSLGNREIVSPQDADDMRFAKEVDDMIDSGDPEWLSKVSEYLGEGNDLFDIPLSDEMYHEIDEEQTSRGL